MKKMDILTDKVLAIPTENIDTDQIIPARFLKTISKSGLGENLFADWRYD
jgi:3-isopropylmalate/(R)-2-methylmalate dehydratase small subunit